MCSRSCLGGLPALPGVSGVQLGVFGGEAPTQGLVNKLAPAGAEFVRSAELASVPSTLGVARQKNSRPRFCLNEHVELECMRRLFQRLGGAA